MSSRAPSRRTHPHNSNASNGSADGASVPTGLVGPTGSTQRTARPASLAKNSSSGNNAKDTLLTDITDSDDFRMYCMKVLPCSKRLAHDWTTCVFAHNGEKARRRDPRKFKYTGIACVDMKDTGSCERGDDCPYAHSTFEYWLHPTRYRTQLCKDMGNCRRETCFFAHRTEELRVPDEKPYISPEQLAMASLSGIRRSMEKEREITASAQRKQPTDLAFTPYSHAQSEVTSPRASLDPSAVRSSAPLSDAPVVSMLARNPGNQSWLQQPVRRSLPTSNAPMVDQNGSPFDIQTQRADEIALADALAKLSVTLNQRVGSNDRSKDEVIQTVHQVLQQALNQRESSLDFGVNKMGGRDFSDGSSVVLEGDVPSARTSSDIGSPPLLPYSSSTEALGHGGFGFSNPSVQSPTHAYLNLDTRTIDPWKTSGAGSRLDGYQI